MLRTNSLGRRFATMTTRITADRYTEVLKFCQQKNFESLSEFLRHAIAETIKPDGKKLKLKRQKKERKSIQELLAEIESHETVRL